MTPNSQFLSAAIGAVKEAEKVVKKYYSKDIRATLKADASPVTAADSEAEQIIRKIISDKFPNHGFLGEEMGQTSRESEFVWIIDPIDGTKNYMRQIPLFATQIALMKGDEAVLGVSNAPEINEMIYAQKGEGAFLNGERIGVSNISKLSDAYLSFGGFGYFEKNNLLKNLLEIEKNTLGHRGFGDAWSYHLLATGKIDVMVEAETHIWDIAAVSIIVEEAGGKVTDLKGDFINHNSTSILATNGLLHDQILNYFK